MNTRKTLNSRTIRSLVAIAVGACTAFEPHPAAAAEPTVQLANHDGTFAGTLMEQGKWPSVGTIIAASFRPEHRFALKRVELRFQGVTGRKVELHVWRDNGGLQPGAPEGRYTTEKGADWMPPKVVYIETIDALQTVDLSSANLELPAVEPFWIGIKVLQAGASLAVDAYEKDKNPVTSVFQTETGDCKDMCGVPQDLMITAQGDYVQPVAKRWFTDVTKASGLSPGSRMAWADFDEDGDLDCLVAGRTLYINDGHGTFVNAVDTGLEKLSGDKGLWADFDNDGVLDLLSFGGEEAVLRGIPKAGGKGHSGKFEVFQALPEAADGTHNPTEAAVWLDIDNDGFVDLYTANYEKELSVCDHDFLWRNVGGKKFEDVSEKYGIRAHGKQCGRGATAADWDQDGDVDLFVGNYRLDANFFFVNEFPGAALTNIAKQNGTIGEAIQGAYGHTIGPSFVDADSDGDFDLFVANLAHPRFIAFSDRSMFYQNRGSAEQWTFSEHRQESGITYQETNSDARFGDFDNDGLPDLAITNVYKGRIGRLWRNLGPQAGKWLAFKDVTYESGVLIDNGWGSAWPDIDGDGDVDYVANRLMRNDLAASGQTVGGWLKVRLVGTDKVNRAAIGAWVVVHADGKQITRQVSGGDALSGQSGLVMHFGVGTAKTISRIDIHWPGGAIESDTSAVAVNQVLTYAEGFTKPQPAELDAGTADGTQARADTVQGDGATARSGTKAGGGSQRKADDGGCRAGPDGRGGQGVPIGLLLALLAVIAAHRERKLSV